MEFVYVAYFITGVYEEEIPQAFFSEEGAKAFCAKKNQEVLDKWNKKHMSGYPEDCLLTLEELLDSGSDYWTYQRIKVAK